MSDNFFEHGSRWVKVDFHLHTKADKEFKYEDDENDYSINYARALAKASVNLGIITNHDKFDLDEFRDLRKKTKQFDIGLLPGVELSVTDGQLGLHILVVFSEEWIKKKNQSYAIELFLNSAKLNPNNNTYLENNHRPSKSISEIVKLLDDFEMDYFLVFPHVEQSKGLWKELSPGRVKDLFQLNYVRKRILAFQKVRTLNKRKIFKQALGRLYPAEVEGSDSKNLIDVSKGDKATYVKLGEFSFKSVKHALTYKNDRLRKERPSYKHSHIREISFDGTGALGGTKILLSPELNTIIGARGSGKSSILEGIRYTLNIPFGEKAQDTDYKNALVDYQLGNGGKVCIDSVGTLGSTYEIQRILNHEPDVFIDGQKQPGVSIRESVLNRPLYFGQKDLALIGSSGFEKDLIEKLAGDSLIPLHIEIKETKKQIADIINKIKNVTHSSCEKNEWEEKLLDAQHSLKFYKKYGVETKLQKQLNFNRDEIKIQQTIKKIEYFIIDLNDFIVRYEVELKEPTLYKSIENTSFFNAFFHTYQQLNNGIDNLKKIAIEGEICKNQLRNQFKEFEKLKASLKEEFAKVERKIIMDLQENNLHSINLEKLKKIKTDIDEAKKRINLLNKSESIYKGLNQQLLDAVNRLDDLWQKEYLVFEKIVKKFNQTDSQLKIESHYKADKVQMLNFIQDLFKGSRIRNHTLKTVVSNFLDFKSIWQDDKNELSSLLGNSFDNFKSYFLKHLYDFITWQVPNIFSIKYKGEKLITHSLGQRASALLIFILNQHEHDLVIIDQPEDDLDNQTIYQDIIKLIRKFKSNTQFIFVTHNANIPVLGDAEKVIVCNYSNKKVLADCGSIDCNNIQESIVNIMEGGAEAFEKRKHLYNEWESKNYK